MIQIRSSFKKMSSLPKEIFVLFHAQLRHAPEFRRLRSLVAGRHSDDTLALKSVRQKKAERVYYRYTWGNTKYSPYYQ